jgi:hypothetical protein
MMHLDLSVVAVDTVTTKDTNSEVVLHKGLRPDIQNARGLPSQYLQRAEDVTGWQIRCCDRTRINTQVGYFRYRGHPSDIPMRGRGASEDSDEVLPGMQYGLPA